MWKVTWSKSVEKDLTRVPDFIRQKSRAWVVAVEHDGMPAVRELKGSTMKHFEALDPVNDLCG